MDFSKVMLVLKREYLTRVKTRSFILSTLLTPLVFVGFIVVVVLISLSESEPQKTVGLVDQTEVLASRFIEMDENRYKDVSDVPLDTLRAQVLSGKLDAYLLLSEDNLASDKDAELIYGGSGGISFLGSVENDYRRVVREELLSRAEVSDEVRKIFESRPNLDEKQLTEEGEKKSNAGAATALGIVLGILIFIGLFGYGAVLMRSVIEEKTNRIVEVIASSVKPIELMFGKLFGVCALALTQFGIWIATYIALSVAAAPIAGMIVEAQTAGLPEEVAQQSQNFDPSTFDQFIFDPSIFVYFFLFFLIGFSIYASLFAAIGAAVDSEQDTQQFMMPLMLPIMVGYILNFRVAENPDSTVAFIGSMFPLTAPINMVTRIASTEVPIWQIALSLALMIGSFIGLMWLSARIYRVGILMYGKKPSFKELAKWIRQS